MIQYGRHLIDSKDINAVTKVLKSSYLTQGPILNKFEKEFAKFVGAKYAVSSNNCSNSLISACISLGLEKDDWVWCTANTFVASTNCAMHLGAKLEFIDIDTETFNMSINHLKSKLKKTPKSKLPKVLISVHFAGLINYQEEIWKLSKQYGFFIIEDCCHALGGSRNNEMAGSCKYSHISVFSFHPVKAMTTGEGGMATTNYKNLKDKMFLINNHGINKNKKKLINKKKLDFYYEQILLGYNFRLTDFQSALGLSQLKKLKLFIKKRNQIADEYNKELNQLPIKLPKKYKNILHAFHLYIINLKNIKIRNTLYEYLIKNKIKCNQHYIPVYKQPFYKDKLKKKMYLKNTENYYKTSLSLPLYVSLSKNDQKRVINTIKKFFA